MSEVHTPKQVTVPVRVPDEIYAQVRQWAGLKGITPGDALRQAWDQWLAAHKEEILSELDALRSQIEAV